MLPTSTTNRRGPVGQRVSIIAVFMVTERIRSDAMREARRTPSGPVPFASTRWPVGVSQMPSSFHAIRSCMLGTSSTSICQRARLVNAACVLTTLCACGTSPFLRDSTFQSSSTWRQRVTPFDLTEIRGPRATEKYRCSSEPLESASLPPCSLSLPAFLSVGQTRGRGNSGAVVQEAA